MRHALIPLVFVGGMMVGDCLRNGDGRPLVTMVVGAAIAAAWISAAAHSFTQERKEPKDRSAKESNDFEPGDLPE